MLYSLEEMIVYIKEDLSSSPSTTSGGQIDKSINRIAESEVMGLRYYSIVCKIFLK